MSVQLRHLRYFVHIVDAGSFSRAATIANVAQPALSQQIATLEALLGVTLLHRTARGTRPTEAGLVLYRHARSILRQVDHLPTLLHEATQEPSGPVSLGMPQTLSARVGPAFIAACRTRYPKVLLRIVEGTSAQLRDSLTASKIDISLIHEELNLPGLTYHPIFYQELFLLGPDDGKGPPGDSITPESLAELPLLLPTPPNAVRDKLDRYFARFRLAPQMVAEVNSFRTSVQAVKEGLGYTVMPWPATEASLGGDGLRAWRLDPGIEIVVSFAVSTLVPVSSAALSVQKFFGEFLEARVVQEGWIGARLQQGYLQPL